MKIMIVVFSAVISIMVSTFELLFRLNRGAKDVSIKVDDYLKARQLLGPGGIVCPNGHCFPVEGEVYECLACGWVYTGSIFNCTNPECGATTQYVNCPECGLSVRNPYRLGRP